jgi:hypothetical protein
VAAIYRESQKSVITNPYRKKSPLIAKQTQKHDFLALRIFNRKENTEEKSNWSHIQELSVMKSYPFFMFLKNICKNEYAVANLKGRHQQ